MFLVYGFLYKLRFKNVKEKKSPSVYFGCSFKILYFHILYSWIIYLRQFDRAKDEDENLDTIFLIKCKITILFNYLRVGLLVYICISLCRLSCLKVYILLSLNLSLRNTIYEVQVRVLRSRNIKKDKHNLISKSYSVSLFSN